MFSPNLSNRGKANFVIGVVVIVSLFWLLSLKLSPAPRDSEERQVSQGADKVVHKEDDMAGNVVELTKDMDLLSPPLPEDIEKSRESFSIKEGTVDVGGLKVFYREAKPAREAKVQVLLLHGQAFSSQNWMELGTLQYLAAMNYRAVAIDIPGYGKSRAGQVTDPVTFMNDLLTSLDLSTPVIISPSMSGSVSLPFLTAHPDRVKGYIPVAPVFTGKYTSHYPSIRVPTVIVYGDKDMSLGPESLKNLSLLPNSCVVKLENARHPAYLDQPLLWHTLLYNFLNKY